MKIRDILFTVVLLNTGYLKSQGTKIFSGADEKTPSKAMYFDWINSEWPGTNEKKTLANMDFFLWLKNEYGMQLDIYHLDAGNIDQSPHFAEGARNYQEGLRMAYGSLESDRLRSKFPNGFKPIVSKANQLGCGLGIWLGPDGFGDSKEEAEERIKMLVQLAKEGFTLFKFDAAVSGLREEKSGYFVKAMTEVRKVQPGLIALNHRIKLNADAAAHMTTYLFEGAETYIDVHMTNDRCAPHHRAQALSRQVPKALQRLTEDHGVCLSSCLDYWEDDLVLQAFNRCLLLAPEIYGNPWLLKDEEYATLAWIFNTHRRYRNILVNGMQLSEQVYGPVAVARGDKSTRILALRNLTWEPVKRKIQLSSAIGLTDKGNGMVDVRMLFPYEKYIGNFRYGLEAEVEILPYRACLLLVTTKPEENFYLWGCNYQTMRDVAGKPVEINLLGMPGETVSFRMEGLRKFSKAWLEGKEVPELLQGRFVTVVFEGKPWKDAYHRKIASLRPVPVPADAEALYEATCFAADNNALEARSLYRSGPSAISQVNAAREAFFNDRQFVSKSGWDKYLFDDDLSTFFNVHITDNPETTLKHGALRLDCGKIIEAGKIVIRDVGENDNFKKAEVSTDLLHWEEVLLNKKGKILTITVPAGISFRYLRINVTPTTMSEIEGYRGEQKLDRSQWRCSNLFKPAEEKKAKMAFSFSFVLDDIPEGSYLAIAIPGRYGNEGAYAALRVDGNLVGAPDRAPSYESDVFEHVVKRVEGFYTYYIPLHSEMAGKKMEAVVLGYEGNIINEPELWITAYPVPFKKKKLILEP